MSRIEATFNNAHETAEWRPANVACCGLSTQAGHKMLGMPLLQQFLPCTAQRRLSKFVQEMRVCWDIISGTTVDTSS